MRERLHRLRLRYLGPNVTETEAGIVEALSVAGTWWPSGYELAVLISARSRSAKPAHGTLYRALHHLTDRGVVEVRWEDTGIPEAPRQPRYRLIRQREA